MQRHGQTGTHKSPATSGPSGGFSAGWAFLCPDPVLEMAEFAPQDGLESLGAAREYDDSSFRYFGSVTLLQTRPVLRMSLVMKRCLFCGGSMDHKQERARFCRASCRVQYCKKKRKPKSGRWQYDRALNRLRLAELRLLDVTREVADARDEIDRLKERMGIQ